MTTATPELDTLVEEVLGSITILLERLREKSALVLLYSAIDVLGALDTEDGGATRASFTGWVDRYMMPQATLGCSALDLYSARCGVLHTLSPDTLLTARGAARPLVYVSWPVVFPDHTVSAGPLLVHLPTLWVAFRDGTRRFQADAGSDSDRAIRIGRNLSNVYVTRST